MASQPSKEELEQAIRDCFKEMDKDKDGVISTKEIHSLLTEMFGKSVKMNIAEVVMQEADKDKSGSINSVDELVGALCSIEVILICSELAAVFKQLDKDGNGTLTKEEITSGWSKIAREEKASEVRDLIAKADTDGDGKINIEEFIGFVLDEMMK